MDKIYHYRPYWYVQRAYAILMLEFCWIEFFEYALVSVDNVIVVVFQLNLLNDYNTAAMLESR